MHVDVIRCYSILCPKQVTMNRLAKESAFPKVQLVHMLQMLYHTRDMEATIGNYYNVLQSGGVLLITIASKRKCSHQQQLVGLTL